MNTLQSPRCPTFGVTLEHHVAQGAVACSDCGAPDQWEVPPAGERPTEPTASELVYLFADRLVPAVTGRATQGGVKVPEQPLANVLFATAFWSLREQGHLYMELDKRSRVRVRVTEREQSQRRALEGLIMANMPTKGGMDASSVIYSCWREDSINPWNDVLQVAAEDVSGMSRDCGKLAALAGAFDDFVRRWQRFQTSEPVLYQALLDECGGGIVARRQGEPTGKGTAERPHQDSRAELGQFLGTGLALGVGLALANSAADSGANVDTDPGAEPRSIFDFLGDFFGGVGDFLGDFCSGVGDFLGDFCSDLGDSFDGGFDFD